MVTALEMRMAYAKAVRPVSIQLTLELTRVWERDLSGACVFQNGLAQDVLLYRRI